MEGEFERIEQKLKISYLIESDIAAARAMYNIAQITSQQPTVEFVADCGFDFLLNEILLMIDSTLLDSNSTADPSMLMESACAKIESMGFSVGHRFVERMAQQKPTPFSTQNNTLECVKFLCKDFWTSVFHKQIDKLQTNHRGVFVLKVSEIATDSYTTTELTTQVFLLARFICANINAPRFAWLGLAISLAGQAARPRREEQNEGNEIARLPVRPDPRCFEEFGSGMFG